MILVAACIEELIQRTNIKTKKEKRHSPKSNRSAYLEADGGNGDSMCEMSLITRPVKSKRAQKIHKCVGVSHNNNAVQTSLLSFEDAGKETGAGKETAREKKRGY
jgi:hypothetical protein